MLNERVLVEQKEATVERRKVDAALPRSSGNSWRRPSRDGKVVAILGVGNKLCDYGEEDAAIYPAKSAGRDRVETG